MSKSGKYFIFFNMLIGLCGFLILAIYLNNKQVLPSVTEFIRESVPKIQFHTINAPKGDLRVVIASSTEELEKGLGGVFAMDRDQGMLFVFPIVGSKNFWMKNMFFPLDIIWIGEDKKVIGLLSNIAPDSYPQTYSSPDKVKYVLEINAGEAEKFGIATGTLLTFVM